MMECEHVAELLPWHLNRTLEAAEEHQVEAHLEGCEKCRRVLAEARFAAAAACEHLPPEVLVEYGFEDPTTPMTLTTLDRALVQAHLESCPRCAEELAMVRQCHRLAQQDDEEVVSLEARRRTAPAWHFGAVAASLVALVAATGWFWSWQDSQELRSAVQASGDSRVEDWEERMQEFDRRLAAARAEAEELRRRESRIEDELQRERAKSVGLEARVAALEGPQINAWVEDVFPRDLIVRQGGAPVNELERPPGAARLELNLSAALDATHSQYEVELVDASGRQVWQGAGLKLRPEGYFHLKLPVDLLPAEGFEIRVFGFEDGRRTQVARYPIQVRPPG